MALYDCYLCRYCGQKRTRRVRAGSEPVPLAPHKEPCPKGRESMLFVRTVYRYEGPGSDSYERKKREYLEKNAVARTSPRVQKTVSLAGDRSKRYR